MKSMFSFLNVFGKTKKRSTRARKTRKQRKTRRGRGRKYMRGG